MTKSITVIILFISLFISCSLAAGDNLGFTVKPVLNHFTGYTKYTIEMTDYVNIDGTHYIGGFKSALEFPLNAFMAGGEATLQKKYESGIDWSISLSFLTNLHNPSKFMVDEDWIRLGFTYFEVSYTESEFDLGHTIFKAKLKKRIYSKRNNNLYLFGGFRYQKITQNILNFRGWQIDLSDPELKRIDINEKVNALYYEITYKAPFLGLSYDINPNERVAYEFGAAYMLTFVSDFDDHLLRFKTATSDGTGHGILGLLGFKYFFENKLFSSTPFIGVDGELIYSTVSTEQTQEWYGDEPNNDWDETGVKIEDIPNDITSFQFNVNMTLGFRF